MIRSLADLKGYDLYADDGRVGDVRDCSFDDETWTVRYLVADAGGWVERRPVPVSPLAVTGIDDGARTVRVGMSRRRLLESPAPERGRPVSRRYEFRYYNYFAWPTYWGMSGRWGAGMTPGYLLGAGPHDAPERPPEADEYHIKSADDLRRYIVDARDGELGSIEDLLVDDASWAVRYAVVDTVKWWPSRKALVSPQWIDDVDWQAERVFVDLSRRSVRESPAYGRGTRVTREYEERLFAHYGRSGDIDAVAVRAKAARR